MVIATASACVGPRSRRPDGRYRPGLGRADDPALPEAEAHLAAAIDWSTVEVDAGELLRVRRTRRLPRVARSTTTVRRPRIAGTPSACSPPAAAEGVSPGGGMTGQHDGGRMTHDSDHYTLHVNGVAREVRDAWLGESLLYVLRERLGLMGTKGACEQGECGSCSVHASTASWCAAASCWPRRPSASRSSPSRASRPSGAPSDVQQAFVEAGAVQCGFCTPGLIMADARSARANAGDPTEIEIREELSGNICRCTGLRPDHRRRAAGGRRPSERGHDRRRDRTAVDVDPVAFESARHDRRLAHPARRRRQGAGLVRVLLATSSADGFLWGATLRSPHPYARIVSHRRVSAAWKIDGVEAVITADDVPGQMHLRADQPGPAGVRDRRRALRGRAGRRRRRRPPRDVPPGARRDRRRVRGARPAPRPRGGRSTAVTRRSTPTATSSAISASCAATRRSTGAVVVEGTYEIGMQDQAFLGLEAALAVPDPGRRRRRAARRHPVAARGPQADRRLPRPAARAGASGARRRRRSVRRPRGHQPAGAHLPARAAHRPSGAHGVQPRRELPRPRAPPPGDDLDAPPRHRGRRDRARSRRGSCSTAARTRPRRRRC